MPAARGTTMVRPRPRRQCTVWQSNPKAIEARLAKVAAVVGSLDVEAHVGQRVGRLEGGHVRGLELRVLEGSHSLRDEARAHREEAHAPI